MEDMEALARIPSKTLSSHMASVLSRRIIDGEYKEGEKLPTERQLSEEFGVNRHAIREAIKRIEALGLVQIRHGSGIYAQKLNMTAGIEIFNTLLTDNDGSLNIGFLKDVLEFRRHYLMNLTLLALRRRKPRELGKICRIIDNILFNRGKKGSQDESADNYALFQAIVLASHNHVYYLMYITLSQVIQRLPMILETSFPPFSFTEDDLRKMRHAFEFSNEQEAKEVLESYLQFVERLLKPYLGDEKAKED
ncbi:MAG TPA: GntR family transcriptional regulator [Candidatus Hydrogenedentes bacterium]|jgi:DNA-binding FadR family transcriptional regulator|nr:MAG: HTH-type transcriptional regulator Mce2R [Candidatus Hydrogenedentes bacterium ADurb.Bin170]HNZ49443.1 GntR family transcriptional regulator [Candidatus Hydrogenedentota bacterium]HOD95477.1 GntR family transcriptional regulator [Candidatus Hydrogenedentota bacterium]HOM47415.1 GntR family transcriptional regulator [Candidatus Hydrogenedentota bacterium]HOR50710.1 GntR family transcriptional regulator [Candidatus Hydrogenedentota bacterium]